MLNDGRPIPEPSREGWENTVSSSRSDRSSIVNSFNKIVRSFHLEKDKKTLLSNENVKTFPLNACLVGRMS